MRRLRYGPKRRNAEVWRQYYLKYRRKGWSQDKAARKAFELEDKHYRKQRMKQLTPEQRRELEWFNERYQKRRRNRGPGCMVHVSLILIVSMLVLLLWAWHQSLL